MSGDVVERLRDEADKVLKGGPIWGEGETVATIKEAADLIAQLTKERDAALDKDWVAFPAYAAAMEDARQHRDRAETAERQLAEARAALEPFARYETADGEGLDDELFRIPDGHALLGNGIGDNWAPAVTVGDFRRARTLTNGGENGR